MGKVSGIICLLFIGILSSCEKPSASDTSPDCCLPPLDFEGDSFSVDTAKFLERIFMPSGFTPGMYGYDTLLGVVNDTIFDGINDSFFVSVNGTQYFDYEFDLKIYLGQAKFFDTTYSGSENPPKWDGYNSATGSVNNGIYKAELNVTRNGIQYKHFTHFLWVLKSYRQTTKVDNIYKCLVFADQFDPRLGVIYETHESFE